MNFTSNMSDCSEIQKIYADLISENSNLDMEFIQILSSSSDAWAISCFDMNITLSIVSSILFSLGVLFIICGFLEPKKK